MKLRFILYSILLIQLCAFAQDANYWTFQYGSRSTLLGGAVIGSVLDLSGTYYNPGAVSLIDNPETILAAKVFEYPRYKLSASATNDFEVSSSNLGPAPSLVATNLKFNWLGDDKLIFSFLTRHDLSLELNHAENFLSASEPNTNLIINSRLQEKMNETWFGLTWSRAYGSRIGIGITPYFVFRSHRVYTNTVMQAVTDSEDIYHSLDNVEFNYDHYSVLFKAGITFDFIGQTIGLTVTTPRIGYYGNGSSGKNNTWHAAGASQDTSYLSADYQNDVKTYYKSPFSIALGTTFKIDKTNIYISAEWFNSIDKYEVILSNEYYSQVGSDTLKNRVIGNAKTVLNLGIGIQHTFDNNTTINASITTDYSAANSDPEVNLSLASWDLYHVMLGSAFNFLDTEITLGLGYAFGKDKSKTIRQDLVVQDVEFPFQSSFPVTLSYHSYKFILGFAF